MLFGRRFHDGQSLAQVGVVSHLYRNGAPQRFATVRLVNHHVGNEVFVRHQGLSAIGVFDHGIAGGDFGDVTIEIVDVDTVAHAHRAVEQHNKTRHIIAGDFLQAKTQAHTQSTTEHRQYRQIDAHHGQGNQERQNDEQGFGDVRQSYAQAHVHAREAHQAAFNHFGQPHRQHHDDDHPHHAIEDVKQA